MIVYACAFVCCNIAFQIASVCILHVCVAFVLFFVCLFTFTLGDFVCRCLLYVARLRFRLHVCILQVCLAFACFVCLRVIV